MCYGNHPENKTKDNFELNTDTVKHVYNDHPEDPKIVTVVNKRSLFKGYLCYDRSIWSKQL